MSASPVRRTAAGRVHARHLWILSKVFEKLPPEEIQRRIDRFHDEE